MPNRDSLAAVLRLVRKARKLGVDEFAGAIDPRHMNNLEAGRTDPRLETIEAIANVLNVSPASLLILSSSLGTAVNPSDRLIEIRDELRQLEILGVNEASFAQMFDDGKLISKPAGAQVNSERLASVLECKGKGMSPSETAKKLGIAVTTVRRYWLKG